MLKRESDTEIPEFKISAGGYVRLKGRVHPDAKSETGVEVVSVDEENSRILVKTSEGIKSYSMTFVNKVLEPPTTESIDSVNSGEVEPAETKENYGLVYDNLEVLFELYGLTPKANSFLADSELEKFEKLFSEGREQEILSYLISYSQYIEADNAYIKYLWEYQSVPKMKKSLIRLGFSEKAIEGYFDRTEYTFKNTELLSEGELVSDFQEYLLDKYLPTGYAINQFSKIEKTYQSAIQNILTAIMEEDFSNLSQELDSLLENETPETMTDLRKVERQEESSFSPENNNNSALIVDTPTAPKKKGVSLKNQVKEVTGGEFTVPPTSPPASEIVVPETPKVFSPWKEIVTGGEFTVSPVSLPVSEIVTGGEFTVPPASLPVSEIPASEIVVPETPKVFSPWKEIKISRCQMTPSQQKSNSYSEEDLVGNGKFHILSIYTPKLDEKGKGGFDWQSNVGLPKPTGVDKKFLQPPKITMLRGEQSGITMFLEWYVVSLTEKTGKSNDAGSLALVTSYLTIGQVKIKHGMIDAKLPDSDWNKLLTALLSLNRLRDGNSGKGIEYSLVVDYTNTGEPVKFPLNTPEVFPGKSGVDFSGIRYLDYLSEPQFSVLLKDYRPKLKGPLDIGARIWILALLAFSFQSNKQFVAKELNVPYNKSVDGSTPPFKFIYEGLGQKFRLPQPFMEDLGLEERSETFFDRDFPKKGLQ